MTPNISQHTELNETLVELGDESKYVHIDHDRVRLCYDLTDTHLDLRIWTDASFTKDTPTHHVKVNLETGHVHVVQPSEVF